MWWMFGGEGRASWGAAEDDIARGEAYGDGAHRPGRSLRGVHGRVHLSDQVRRQRLEVDAAVRHEEEVGDHHVRAEVPRRYEHHGATALLPDGGEFTGRSFVDFCDSVGIHRECTAPGKPQQNAVVESAIW